jgi:hypothetical protein
MPVPILAAIGVGLVWLGRIGMAAFALNEIRNLTTKEKEEIDTGFQQAQAAGMSDNDAKQIIAATTYDRVESEGKSPDDFWAGLSQSEKDALAFSPESLRRSMDRTKFGGFGGALLFVAAAVAAGFAAKRGIPIGVKTLAKIAEARKSGASALQLMTIFEEGKILGLSKVWVPAATAGLLTAGGYYVSGLTNNMNDADLWGRIFLGQAADDFAKAAKQGATGSGGSGGGLTSSPGPRTIIRMVEEKKPQQFLGTLFSAKLGKLEHFDRKLDDEITDMDDLEADVKINVNQWLKTLPGRMGYSIVIRKDPVDENGVQQSGIWATATLHVLQLSGKIMPIDTILLGPVTPAVRLELARSTKTIETQIDGILSAQEIREIDIPNGVVDIFNASGDRVFAGDVANKTTPATTTQEDKFDTSRSVVVSSNAEIETYKAQGWDIRKDPNNPRSAIAVPPKAGTTTPTAPKSPTPNVGSGSSSPNSNTGGSSSGTTSALASAGTLRKGDNGRAVEEIQVLLNNWGENLVIDGDFGNKTDAAIRKFQSANGLVVDGIVGPKTKEMLFIRGR